MAIDYAATTTYVRPSPAASVGLLLARVPLGVYFVLAGINKFTAPGGASAFREAHMANAAKWMGENLAQNFLTALPYAEIALGAFLIMGLVTRIVAGLMALLLISFTISTTGVMFKPLPFHPNVIYIGLSLALMLCGGGWIGVDGLLFRPRRRVAANAVVRDDVVARPGDVTP